MRFEIILITSPDTVANEAKWINKLFKAGLKKLHIRKPSLTRTELRRYILDIPKKHHSRLVLHSHYSLTQEFALGGIHLTERTKKQRLPASYNKKKHSLSASFHSLNDIARSRRKYDTIFLSPIFNSVSKRGYKKAFRPKELYLFLRKHKNIIALGGVNDKTMVFARKMGFKGVATLGYIWQSRDPLKAFDRLRSEIK